VRPYAVNTFHGVEDDHQNCRQNSKEGEVANDVDCLKRINIEDNYMLRMPQYFRPNKA